MNQNTLFEQFKKKLSEDFIAAGLIEQMELMQERYGEEYLHLATKILSVLEKLGYNAFNVCQAYLYDYLKQMSRFLKTGTYGNAEYEKIKETIYNNEDVMINTYMPGLLLAYASTSILYTKYHLFKTRFIPLINNCLAYGGVEVGFGEGFYLWELSNNIPNVKFSGFDISEHAVNFAFNLLSCNNIPKKNYQLQTGDIMTGLPVPDSFYSFGILAEVIEHVENPQNAIKEMHRIIKDGGYLFITTVMDSNHMDHITNFETPEAIDRMLEAAGFSVIDKSIYRIQDDFPKTKDISVGLAYVCRC
ncbi:MAG: class I SAM-dependent methyltransferase [Defluviitaleaceae bacterium]|nr:class I SAM-dependent methyltransferase [Defluviitaleaceae bacterium]